MNKKTFVSIFILAIIVLAVFNVNFNTKRNGLLDLSLANVEALANGEGSGGYSKVTICEMAGGGIAVYCEGSGSLECRA